MIEIQIRRPCSENPERRSLIGTNAIKCNECRTISYVGDKIDHVSVIEWMPLDEAIKLVMKGASLR